MNPIRLCEQLPRFLSCLTATSLFLAFLPSVFAQAPPDTDGDTWPDAEETALGTNPNDPASFPKAGTWTAEVSKSAPRYWYRFESTAVSAGATNSGSVAGFAGAFGAEITDADLGKASAFSALGRAMEFTGPAAGNATGKYVDFGAEIPELINLRPPAEDKTTTVEYWIKTSQMGSTANQTWTSPSLLGHESGGDGDMYWGWISSTGDFGFSTSDITEIYSQRDGNRDVTDGQWHHIALVKEWHVSAPCRSIMYIDGGAKVGGATIVRTTPAGNASYQDGDGGIQYLGFVQTGGGGDVQYIGLLDELAIYGRGLSESEVRLHYGAVVPDSDGDGMPNSYELANGLNPNANDAAGDPDGDGLSNLNEFIRGTNPQNPDTDGDGLRDNVETNTGTFVSATNTGTNPLKADTDGDGLSDAVETGTGRFVSPTNTGTSPVNADTDGDGLRDGVETNTGTFVNATNTGTNPNRRDTDGDGFDDGGEVVVGSNPNSATSIPQAGTWTQEITKSAPRYWYRFEESDPATQMATNRGSATGFNGTYGPEITAADLGKTSVLPSLGKALEFTGPAAGATTGKHVDFGAPIPELTNFRPPAVDKTTTVEYWIRTSQMGSSANQTWTSPSLLARESGGDGDMYWGWFNDQGSFGFSTSDLTEIYSQRDANKDVSDGQWHHIVLIKEWHVSQPCPSTMYIDGGTNEGGITIVRTTAAGNASYQDADGAIQFLGFVQTGGGSDCQYIGLFDELAIYNRGLTEAEVRLHYRAVSLGDTDGDGMPDFFELANGLNPAVNDAAADPDNDGATNLREYQTGSNPQNPDTDGDTLKDGVETGTGVWVSANDRGTNPLKADSDGDGLNDNVETNTGTLVNATNTGTNPNKVDTDGDGFRDPDEIALGTNPSNANSKPAVPSDWVTAIRNDAPLYWWRFEGTSVAGGATNVGSVTGFNGTYGAGIVATNLGKPSATARLGNALEFTGPAGDSATTKFIDFGAEIPELVNLRGSPTDGKATTVEYWIKTTQTGSTANQTWTSPSLFAHESGGDGDMYWGWINQAGQFGFSTSDLVEIYANGVTDGRWHHVVLVKVWNLDVPSLSRMYIDGGALNGGQSLQAITPAGNLSLQDGDGGIQFLGFVQTGGGANVQFIGLIDEVAIYDKAFSEAQAWIHFMAAGAGGGSAPRFNPPVLSGGMVNLSWTGTGTLQETTDLSTNPILWSDVTPQPTTSSYSAAPTGARKLYRLRR